MDVPGYPLVFELNIGDSISIDRSHAGNRITRTLRLNEVRLFTENNSWFPDSLGKRNYYKAEVDISVSGKAFTVLHRPYQMPIAANGYRIYVEGIKEIDRIPNLDPLEKMEKEVRFSVALENEPWGIPSDLEFPLNGYRWRSGSYNNTWSSLVPFNLLYYHKGEDFGAIPGRIEVCAWSDAIIVTSPLSDNNAGGSNGIRIRTANGIDFGYYHCDTDNIDSAVVKGRSVVKGQRVAKTGMTWDGRKSQHYDPHLHSGIYYNDFQISLFPYLIEAYFRKYDDRLLAVAGGYRFADADESIRLDATRSVSRDGEKIRSYRWKLHDGTVVDQPVVEVTYDSPGFYAEELIVESESGAVDKDFLQVRVNGPESGRNIGYGWAYYYPVRNILPGREILFWNRLMHLKEGAEVMIEFGDGTAARKMGEETVHSYSRSGNYTVELSSTGTDGAPVIVKLEVVVE